MSDPLDYESRRNHTTMSYASLGRLPEEASDVLRALGRRVIYLTDLQW